MWWCMSCAIFWFQGMGRRFRPCLTSIFLIGVQLVRSFARSTRGGRAQLFGSFGAEV